jgi:hypothetical protein
MNVFNPELVQKLTEDTFEGLETFFRDSDLHHDVFDRYVPGTMMKEVGFMDVSELEGGPLARMRYNIYTNQGDRFQEHFLEYKCLTFPRGCYFKVVDRAKVGNNFLITLLHVPAYAVSYFALNKHPRESEIALDSLRRYQSMVKIAPRIELRDDYWLKRTAFPIGLDENQNFFFQFDYGNQQHLNPQFVKPSLFQKIFRRKAERR